MVQCSMPPIIKLWQSLRWVLMMGFGYYSIPLHVISMSSTHTNKWMHIHTRGNIHGVHTVTCDPPPPQWNVIHWYSGQHRQKAQQKKCNVLWGWIMPSCVHELCTTGAPRSLRCSLIVKPQITTPQSPCVWELDSGGARNELHIQI